MTEEILNIEQAAEFLSMSVEAVTKLVETKKIPGIKENGLWKIKKKLIHDGLNYQLKSLNHEDLAHLEINQEKKFIEIHKILSPQYMVLSLQGNSKSTILSELADTFAKAKNKDKKDILLKAIRDREQLCTTAITEGVAIPHPRHAIKNLVKKPFIVFGRSKAGVDFESIDGNPTKLFFLVCAPKEDVHLKIMARLSRLLRNYEFKKALLEAENKEQIIEIVTQFEKKDVIKI